MNVSPDSRQRMKAAHLSLTWVKGRITRERNCIQDLAHKQAEVEVIAISTEHIPNLKKLLKGPNSVPTPVWGNFAKKSRIRHEWRVATHFPLFACKDFLWSFFTNHSICPQSLQAPPTPDLLLLCMPSSITVPFLVAGAWTCSQSHHELGGGPRTEPAFAYTSAHSCSQDMAESLKQDELLYFVINVATSEVGRVSPSLFSYLILPKKHSPRHRSWPAFLSTC